MLSPNSPQGGKCGLLVASLSIEPSELCYTQSTIEKLGSTNNAPGIDIRGGDVWLWIANHIQVACAIHGRFVILQKDILLHAR